MNDKEEFKDNSNSDSKLDSKKEIHKGKESKIKDMTPVVSNNNTNGQIDGIHTAKSLYDGLWELYEGKTSKRYSTGFKDLDPFMRLVKPSFILMTGTPNCGKSSLTYSIIMKTARKYGFKYMIFSPEHSLAINLKRLIEKYVQKPFDIMFENRCTIDEVTEAVDFIEKHFFFVDKKGDSPDIDWILQRAKYCVDNYQIDGIVTDPYNEINPARSNLREDEHISVLISKIKRFNRETNTITFMVAHPTKQIRNPDGLFEVKSLYDVSGSSHWNNKTDLGVIVTRDFERGQTKVRIAKVREVGVGGNIGETTLRFNMKTMCYDSLMDNKF